MPFRPVTYVSSFPTLPPRPSSFRLPDLAKRGKGCLPQAVYSFFLGEVWSLKNISRDHQCFFSDGTIFISGAFFFFFRLFLRERQNYRERRGREILTCWFTCQMSAMAGIGLVKSQEQLPISHMDAGARGLEPSSITFPGHKQGAGSKAEQPGLELGPMGDAGAAVRGSACYFTMPALWFLYWVRAFSFIDESSLCIEKKKGNLCFSHINMCTYLKRYRHIRQTCSPTTKCFGVPWPFDHVA